MFRLFSFLIVITCNLFFFVSCKKDKLLVDPSAKISFSQDSILFDTVFTTIGSTTRQIRVVNNNNQKINISSVRLEKGQNSNFFLNVDGIKGKQVNDVEILANDSIYIFVQVNVNPTNALSPLIINDKIVFDVNGNQQSVTLEAWGQDAHYHMPNKAIQYKNGYLPYSTVASQNNVTVTWGGGPLGQSDDDKPHVIYGWLVVDSTQKLVINPGIKIYFHQSAGLWVYRYGTLQVNGNLGKEVIFQGDRREEDYKDLPGQWDRIWINEGSTNNYINYAIIKNNFIGIQASILSNPNEPRKLKITNSIIQNCSKWGLYTQYFDVWSANSVFSNCKEYCAALTLGGNYTFLHTTFANYFNKDGGRGGQPCLHIDNFDGKDVIRTDSIYIANSIIEGSQANELELDIRQSGNSNQKCTISHCLLRSSAITNTLITNSSNIYNKNPDFSNSANYNFTIKPTSSAVQIGNPSILLSFPFLVNDISGRIRNTKPDAGAYSNQ